jgi:hypothetical protein
LKNDDHGPNKTKRKKKKKKKKKKEKREFFCLSLLLFAAPHKGPHQAHAHSIGVIKLPSAADQEASEGRWEKTEKKKQRCSVLRLSHPHLTNHPPYITQRLQLPILRGRSLLSRLVILDAPTATHWSKF